MSSVLFILNDAPYGNERAYNALRLAVAMASKDGIQIRLFLMADSVACAKAGQKVWDSLQGKLLCLPNELEIFPGHQAGSACGVGLSGKPSSTIGFEKRFNPSLGLDKASFVRELTADIAPRPADMDRIVAVNMAA